MAEEPRGEEHGQDHPTDAAVEVETSDARESSTANEHADDRVTAQYATHDDSTTSLPLPSLTMDHDDSSSVFSPSREDDHDNQNNQTLIEEREMRRKLMEMESSFLPEPSTVGMAATGSSVGADDTYLVGVTGDSGMDPFDASQAQSSSPAARAEQHQGDGTAQGWTASEEHGGHENTDPEATPNPYEGNTTSLETITSSPTTAAASRAVARVLSSSSRNNEANGDAPDQSATGSSQLGPGDYLDPTPRNRSLGRSLSPGPRLFSSRSIDEGDSLSTSGSVVDRRRNRPKFLTSRQSTHRFSYSSVTSTNTDTNSDATMGMDYALQSGGAVPGHNDDSQTRGGKDLARTISLGSMASGVSGYSEENSLEKRAASGVSDGGLHTLEEEHPSPRSSVEEAKHEVSEPVTPKAAPQDFGPPETAFAESKDIRPSTAVKQFRESKAGRVSPDKDPGVPTPAFGRSGRSMTLKEQSSTIDRLSKENFDLKMRIHFLNEALNKRSEEGIKEMISENVELKSDKLKLQKDNQSLRRRIRDLEKEMKDREQSSDKDSVANNDPEVSDDENRAPAEEEILYLRERMETYELEIERLRSESIAREGEKRRLAEIVKSLGEGRQVDSDAGAREERVSYLVITTRFDADPVVQDMWKDMLDAETAAREQAEEENRRLRDEVLRMKADVISGRPGRALRRTRTGSIVSYSTGSERDIERSVGSTSNALAELELLRQENAELRREVSAQTSMLTSRNREKERLYQEIEELKLGSRRDGRSIAGDSIFERSASRAQGRSSSHPSDNDAPGDPDRETLEIKNGELRDQVSALKLENQNIRAQLDDAEAELEALDKGYQVDMEQAEEEIQTLQQERDQAYQIAGQRENDLEELRAEAQEELDALGDELEQRIDECERLEVELRNQEENLNALQAEMRSASEGIIRLEEDAQNNLQKYKAVQRELDDSNREIESLEKGLFEANDKVQRLTVQIESSQNEIAFLREEQDGDKIRISDLESELKTCQISLHSEKDKARELEQRLAEERHQREVVGSKEKQEVQRMMNELNQEVSASREEIRKLRKNLSAREVEANTWKDRLMELENNLREALGDLDGTRSSLINNIFKLQKELDSTTLELESIRTKLDEKETLLKHRDALLESQGLESRKLADLLERERHARRADKHSWEQSLKSHQQASRTISQNNSRISELEAARSQDRKRFAALEHSFKEQLNERNSVFLTLWKQLSTMCGPDWSHSHSLINGNLPSQEVIGNILFWPGFSKNLLMAAKTLEVNIAGFKNRIKSIDRDLTKQYQTLEHNFVQKMKRLERMEESVRGMRSRQHQRSNSGSASPEVSKLRGENRLLKAELNLLQSHSKSRTSTSAAAVATTAGAGQGSDRSSPRDTSRHHPQSSLVRHYSTNDVETLAPPRSDRALARSSTGIPQPSNYSSATTLTNNSSGHSQGLSEPGQEKWIQRLRELERRLKAEREARLLDRDGARKRLEERNAENEELRARLEKERMRREVSRARGSSEEDIRRTRSSTRSRTRREITPRPRILDEDEDYEDIRHGSDDHSESEGTGICVDIEV
ncbi:anucleate primary sterigmata [Paecilomyces variotii No. 5]|uniref:Anucleate primary sterigmata n=1 Tax=Byssochlamys spectabilis (strain No. 5 / NBRC 109023) TaxID=1356009 RepID=V5FK55_BYSSN|nr:anucleate primary sterigmata [Paecilomyces variotii No. 5]